MHVFLAGIMQGSHGQTALHNQDYRAQLRNLFLRHWPDVTLYDPLANHGNSLEYDHQRGREVFLSHNRMCRVVDLVVAFVPEATMGTAIEMWEAHEHGRGAVITISPLVHNWVVRFCSDAVYSELTTFAAAIESGEVARIVHEAIARHRSGVKRL